MGAINFRKQSIFSLKQPPASISASTVFLACNFSNKRVKLHFNYLKRKWEENLPVVVYISDQVRGRGARDLWKEITNTILEANLAVFDVTSFRPNVILELGYALAHKEKNKIIICRDLTPSGRVEGKEGEWLLSDIPHLYRIEYSKFSQLDDQLIANINKMAPVHNFYRLIESIENNKDISIKVYISEALEILKQLRYYPMERSEFKAKLKNHDVDPKYLGDLFIRFELAKPEKGRKGRWVFID